MAVQAFLRREALLPVAQNARFEQIKLWSESRGLIIMINEDESEICDRITAITQ